MKMKKLLSVLLAAAMVGSLVACGSDSNSGKENSAGTSGSGSAGGAEIHVASWNNAANNLKEIADKFMEENPGKTVVIDYWDSDYTKLKPALQSGNGIPDIFQTQNRDAQAFFNSYGLDVFMNLDELIAEEKDNWPAFVIDMCTGEDGSIYAMPWDIGPCALYYRTDIFDQAGIDPTTLTTWDKYIEAGKTLKGLGDYYIADLPFNGTGMDLVMLLLNEQGGQYLDEEGKANFNNPEMVKTFELITKMKDENLIVDTPSAWDDRITAINDNRLVAFPYAAWYMGTLKTDCKDSSGKWAITELPAFEEGGANTANIGGSVLFISSDTKQPDLAKEFLKYSMMTDAGNDINLKYGEFPSYTPSYASEAFKQEEEYFGGQVCGEFFTNLTDSPVTEFGPYFTDINESMNQVTGYILGGEDIAKALDDGTADAQNKLDAH